MRASKNEKEHNESSLFSFVFEKAYWYCMESTIPSIIILFSLNRLLLIGKCNILNSCE